MKTETTRPFDKDYTDLPEKIKDQTDKQLTLLLSNPRYPSLHLKKMEGYIGIWEGRISKAYRFTFQIERDTYILRRIGTHDILRNP